MGYSKEQYFATLSPMLAMNRFTHTAHSSLFIAIVIFFCLTQLSGCGAIGRGLLRHRDGPPSRDIDVSQIKDAIPRVEPHHPYGTKDYVLGGRRYKVLKNSKGYVKTGYASWYGTSFHGKHTATQEKYNLYAMTAASKELPLPSYAEVVNLRNGKKVIVRVNDRGPFHGKRIIDLSYAAAKKLGFADHGVAPVRVTAIDPKAWKTNLAHDDCSRHSVKTSASHDDHSQLSTKPSIKPTIKPDSFAQENQLFLQLGAFSSEKNAQSLADRIRTVVGHDHGIAVLSRSNIYKLRLGPLANLEDGKKLKGLLETKGFTDVMFIR